MKSIAPNNNIEIPTAKKVNPTRIGLRKLDLMERPTVAGSFDVNLCNLRDETFTSCCPLKTFKGCKRDACQAGRIPASSTMIIAIITI